MQVSKLSLASTILFFVCHAHAESPHSLKPLLAVPDQVVLENDFSDASQLRKDHWRPNMGTRWAVVDGVLRGMPSTAEYQASKPDHQGFEPRILVPVTPTQCIARFSVRFSEGAETAIVPFIEIGHHVARVKFTNDSVFLLADHDSLKVAETRELKYEPGRWYHVLAELKGDEFVIQFADGPTLYAKDPSYALPPPSGAPGLGIAGPKGGVAEIDNVTIWSIKPTEQSDWAARQKGFAKFEPVRVKEKPLKNAKTNPTKK
jgi:hypothetical protein